MPSQVIVPQSLRIWEVLTVALGFGLSTIAICARLYTKGRIVKKFLLEDYFSIAGYLGFLAYLGLAIIIGKNTGDPEHKAYLSMVETILYDPIVVLIKVSILLQYVTVFVAHRRNLFHYSCHVLIWFIVIFYIAVTFLYIFQCNPRQKLWVPSTPGQCNNSQQSRGILSGAINVASDFLILFLPLPILLRLQMPSTKKLRPLLVFGFGLFACIASVVRLVYSIKLDPGADTAAYQLTIDKEGLWAFAELAIGIIVGCMPHVHKTFRHFSSKMPSGSSFKILTGSSGGSSWRRLFGKSSKSTSEAGGTQNLFGSKESGSMAPHIGALNLTRASFSSAAEKELPKVPSPVHAKEAITRKPLPPNRVEAQPVAEKAGDPELAVPATDVTTALDLERQARSPSQPWQGHQCQPENRRNETRRAQYDLYPRT